MTASSSAVWADVSSSRGSTPNACTPMLPNQLSTRMTGRNTPRYTAVERRDAHERLLRVGQRDVLRHDLADDHVQEHHDDQRDHHGHTVGDLVTETEPPERRGEQLGHRRLGDHAQSQRGHRDPELRSRELQVDVAHGVERAFRGPVALGRGRFELGRPRTDHGELERDEEPVDEQQAERGEEGEPDHDAGPLTATSATRWRSIARTSNVQPSYSKRSPTSGMWPSSSSTKPANVS